MFIVVYVYFHVFSKIYIFEFIQTEKNKQNILFLFHYGKMSNIQLFAQIKYLFYKLLENTQFYIAFLYQNCFIPHLFFKLKCYIVHFFK